MDLARLFGGSFIDWGRVEGSWVKRTIPSRLLLFAARRYLQETSAVPNIERRAMLSDSRMPAEVQMAFAGPPLDTADSSTASWGRFVDAAVAAEMEMVSYGERPLLLHELRSGLAQAAVEAGDGTPLARWFLDRREALPGGDLPATPDYLPV